MSDPRLTNPLAGIQAEQIPDPQPNAPLSPPSWLEQLPDNDNPFAARLRADPAIGNSGSTGAAGGPGLLDRLSLNADEAFYRGSLRGIAKLNTLEGIANGQSPPEGLYAGVPNPEYAGMTPQDARAEADRIRLRLAQYETMPGFSGPLEGTAALAGQIGGGLLSPESWITKFPGVRWAIGKVAGEAADTVAGRIVDAALSQGLVQATVDPLQQVGAISANLQDGYDPVRTAEAFGLGAVTGGLLHGGAEALSAVTEPLRTARERLADQEAFAPTAGRIARERFAPPQPAQAAPVVPEINWLRVEDPSFQSFPTTGAPAPLATTTAADEAAIEAARQRAAGIPVEEGAPTPTAEAPLTGQTTVLAGEPTRQFPTIPDPLDLMQSGELTADRAEEIRDQIQTHFDTAENEIFGPEDAAKLRQLHRQSNAAWDRADDARAKELDAQIDEIESRASPEDLAHVKGRGAGDAVDPEMWGVITRNLRAAEADREGGVNVVADQIRYLPSGGAPKNISEREAVAVIGRAMQAEADRGGDLPKFLDDAFKERFERYGGGADAREMVDDQKDRLLALMQNAPEAGTAAVTAPPRALPAPVRPNEQTGYTLLLRGSGPSPQEPGAEIRSYEIRDSKGGVADARITVRGNVADVDDIRHPGGENLLGPAAVRRLARQFFLDNPDITELQGLRVSGARLAEGQGPDGMTVTRDQVLRTPRGGATAPTTAAAAPLEGGIAGDVARQFIAAGRPEAEARGLGALQQTLYENLAARFEGRLGTAEDIYRREGAQITAGEAGELQPGELGQRQRTVDVGGRDLPLNPDGTVTLYHATKTPEAADRVASQRTLRSGGEPSVYLSTAAEGTGYGDHVIAVNVDPALLRIDDEFPNGRADFAIDKRNVKVAQAERMPSGPLTPEEHALTALPIFEPDFPVQPVRSRTVETIAADLQERGRQALRNLGIRSGIIRGPSPRTDELLSRAIAAEVQGAAQREGRALDWYTGRVAEALRVAALIHPELATDANARMAYTAALAITSQGENVRSNVRLTDIAYTYFKEHGRFPTNMSVAEPIPINGNFAKFNDYLERLGPDGLREFLHRQYTVRELEAETGAKLGKILKDNIVNGSAIFGPKIGQGFFQNLNGNFDPVTIDLWFMRAWGRLTGNLVGASEATQAAQRATFVEALQAANLRAPQTLPALQRRADAILAEHEQNFRRYRAEYAPGGTRTKSALVNAAERFVIGRRGIIEQPQSGTVRNWIAARVERARELLAQEGGLNITNADLQALWWYPEKSVYERMGGQDADAINLDYGTAHQELARQKGISDESISRAVGAVDRRPRPATAGDVGGAVEGERGGGGAVAGEGAQAEPGRAPGGEPGGGTAPELEQPGRARIRLATDDANALVTLVRNAADASSGIHELAHDWLERLVRDAANPAAPREFVDDVNKILRPWLGNDGGALTTAQHEQFATGWEQYMHTGRAPTRQLEGVFAQFREWLLQIYQTLTGLGEPLTPEIQGFFDRLHAMPEKRAAAEGRLAEGLVGEPVPGMEPHRVATAGGDSVEVTPIVVEARDLTASNDAGYDARLQPRQRDRAASQQQIREMASRLDPERLGTSAEADRGAPIIGDDGMVESGNGRVMAIRSAYDADGPAAASYREWLGKQGVDVSGYDQPVLVRQRTTPMSPDERQAFARDANRAATLELSAPERAMSDARNLTPDMLDLIRNPDNLEAVQNRDFVRAFVESLPQAEQGAMTTAEGGLSSQGAARIRHAILARAYGGTPDGAAIISRITEATQDEIRSISSALTAAAPQWARLRGDIEAGHVVPEVDLTPELLDAVRRTADLRNRGQSFADFLRQRDAFDVLPPRVEAFMSLFYDARGTRAAGAPRITDALREYANEASKVSAERGLDLGLAPVTADDIQRRIIERARGGGADTGTATIFGRERADVVPSGAGAGADGTVSGTQVQRPGVGEPGAGAGTAGEPGTGSGAGGAGPERPAVEPSAAAGTTTAGVSGRVPTRGTPSPAGGAAASAEGAIRTLHQQAFDLADALNFPLRQGRMAKPSFVGQYDNAQDVVRQRAVADFETIAHEAGHAVERHVGPELTALTNRFATELAPLDYDLNLQRVNEGFAEWLRHYLTSPPGYAETLAPGFAAEFRAFMTDKQPAIMAELDRARAAYQAYQHAPTGEKLDAIVQRSEPETVIGTIRKEGMARSVSMVLSHGYQGIFDDKAPVTKAVRDLARLYREASGNLLNLQGSTNPELLVRMFARAHQAAVRGMLDGVRPYHAIEPQGPSLRDALIKATGNPGIFGRWDEESLKEFSNYLVARRGEVLWNKYDAGQLARRPLAMSKDEVAEAITEAEKANPTFRDAAQMVHDYTRQILRKQYEGGLIDRELYDKLTAEPFYVPLYRNMEDKPMLGAGDRPTAGGAEGPGTVDLIKRQTGSDRDIIDPIQGLMTQSFLVERTLAHNDIIKSFVALAKQAKDAGATGVGRILETVPAHEIRAQKFNLAEGIKNAANKAGIDPDDAKLLLGAVSDTFGDDPIMAQIFRKERTSPRGEPIIFYKDGGELKAVRLIADAEGQALYETLAGLPPVMRDWAVSFGAASASALRAGIVTNPIFALYNFARDQLAVSILMPGTIPFNPRGLVREIAQDRYAQLYTYGGGVSPGAGAAAMPDMLVDRSVDALARKGWAVQKIGAVGDITKGEIKPALKAVAEVIETAETGTRLNVFKRVFEQKKRQGLNDYDAMLEAAFQATDLLDFSRHGSGTNLVRSLVPFINAHMQSLDKARRNLFVPLYRAATGDVVTQGEVEAVKNAALSWGLVGVSAALGTAYAVWASHYEAYRDANEDLRATHLIIPGDAIGLPGKNVLPPKPFELAIGFNLGEMLGLKLMTNDPRTAQFALAGIMEVLMPPNVLNSIPLLKNYAELALNRSFFTQRDIVPSHMQGLVPAEQILPTTSFIARQIGRAIGVSPIKVDYAIGNSFGLWGKDVLAASNIADPDAPTTSLESTMFLRRAIKGADIASETTKRFWNLAAEQTGEYAQAKTTYEYMLHQFRDKDAAAFLAALPTSERAYVTLQSSADEDGKPVFNGDDKRLNPLTRAATAVLTNNAFIRDLQTNVQTGIESGERFNLTPDLRRDIIENLRILSAMEQRNALVMTGEPAYAGRRLLSTEDQFKVIQAISPQVADEVAARYATAKITPTETVARLWPEAQKRLLADGSEAELRELAFDAMADGAAFEGDRVKKAPKRRLPITPAAPRPTLRPALP